MTESYREMEQRHAALDYQEERQKWRDRWIGQGEDHIVADPEPDTVRDCSNCYHAAASQEAGYWCRALDMPVFGDGKIGCSGWPWDPKDEVAA